MQWVSVPGHHVFNSLHAFQTQFHSDSFQKSGSQLGFWDEVAVVVWHVGSALGTALIWGFLAPEGNHEQFTPGFAHRIVPAIFPYCSQRFPIRDASLFTAGTSSDVEYEGRGLHQGSHDRPEF